MSGKAQYVLANLETWLYFTGQQYNDNSLLMLWIHVDEIMQTMGLSSEHRLNIVNNILFCLYITKPATKSFKKFKHKNTYVYR